MRNLLKYVTAAALAVAVGGCATGPGGAFTTSSLTQAQAGAGQIYQVIKTDAALYVQQGGVSAQQAATITLAVNSLGAAVSSFQAISSFGNVDQLATAVLSTATAVVNQLPNISPSDKVAIDAGITVLQVLLPVVLPQQAPAAPTTGTVILTPGTIPSTVLNGATNPL